MPGPIISGFLWSRWRGKRSRHSRCISNPKFYVSGKKPIGFWQCIVGSYVFQRPLTLPSNLPPGLCKEAVKESEGPRSKSPCQWCYSTHYGGPGMGLQFSTSSNFPFFNCHYLFIPTLPIEAHVHIDGLAQDSNNSIANALELLQSCTKPSIFDWCRRSLDRVTPVKYECDSRYMCPQGQDMGVIENFRCGKNNKRGFSKLHP